MKKSLMKSCAKRLSSTTSLALLFWLSLACAQAANILWVSDNGTDSTFSGPDAYADSGWITILQNAGHTVSRYNPPNSQNTRLSASELATINSYDLIIIGRAITSTAFQSPQVIDWNVNVTKPLLTIDAYLARASRLGWCTGSTLPNGTPTPVTAVNLADARIAFIFATVTMNGSTTALPYDEALYQNTSQIVEGPVAGGAVLATASFTDLGGTIRNNIPIIMEWPAGTAVRAGADILGGYRMYFAGGNREPASGGNILTDCQENLTATGEALFVNAVAIAVNRGVVPYAPVAPTNLIALKLDGQAQLSWSSATNALSYNVKRSATPGGPYTTVTNVTGTTYIDTGLVNGTTYYYVVSSVTGIGESGNSTEVSVTPSAAPANVVATLVGGQANLSWSQMPDVESYNVRRAISSGGPYTLLVGALGAINYVDGPLAPGTRYFYIISGNLSSGGESAYSAEVSVLTAPSAPQNTVLLTNLPLLNILGWTQTNPIVGGFVIESSTDGTAYAPLGSVAGTQFVFTNRVQPSTTYYYRVLATNSTGASDYSAGVTVTTPVFSVNINFQLNTSSNFPGYFADLGAVYGLQNNGFTYGWDVLNTANSRQRNYTNSPDYRYDTLNHMQKAGGGSVWEIEVPNGTYELHIVSGDPGNPDFYAQILAEGLVALEGTPYSEGQDIWFGSTNTITVTDGRLTLSNGPRAVNEKINFIDIIPTNPVAPLFRTQPTNLALLEARDATFRASLAAGTLPVTFQWYSPTGPITDATNTTLTVSNLTGGQAGDYYVVAANQQGSVTSAPATLTVSADLEAPVMLSACSLDGRTVGIAFSEKISAAQATDASLFSVRANGVDIQAFEARLRPDQKSVLVILDGVISNTFVASVQYMGDLAASINIGPSSATGMVGNFVITDLGTPNTAGTVYSADGRSFEVTATGTDIAGTADQGYLIATNLSGNFDVRVRVEQLSWSDNTARAGLMARVSTNANSQFVYLHTTPDSPGVNRVLGQLRATTGGTAAGWGATSFPSGLPNAWLRLVRSGNGFIGYRSTNGVDWVETGRTTQAFPSALLVGLATTSHNATNAATAVYRDLHYIAPPQILTPPLSLAVAQGSDATFAVSASSEVLATYQWRFNGGNLTGQTNATLVITNAQSGNAGNYDVIVASTGGSLTSAPASLVLVSVPVITTPPQLTLGTNGRPVQLSVVATGGGLSYQWYGNGPLAFGTNATLLFTNVQQSDAGTYYVVVTNLAGSVTSAPVSLIVVSPPSMVKQPQSWTALEGDTVTFTASASGDSTLTYRWYFNAAFLTGETRTNLVLVSVQLAQQGNYWVVVSNRYGMATSAVAVLTIAPGLSSASPAYSNGTFVTTVTSQVGKSYWLEYKESLNATNWIVLPEQPGNGSDLNLSDPAAVSPTRFYRIGQKTP